MVPQDETDVPLNLVLFRHALHFDVEDVLSGVLERRVVDHQLDLGPDSIGKVLLERQHEILMFFLDIS